MKQKPTDEDKRDGLKPKYRITHADGTPVDPEGVYFVLRLDYHEDGDGAHIAACRFAIRTYIAAIEEHLPHLAADLKDFLSHGRPNARPQPRREAP